MIEHAKAANARLLKVFPKGFALDETHHPHISMLQQFVRTADLDKVFAAADAVFAKEKPLSWTLKAIKYYYIPSPLIGLAGIVVEPTEDMHRLQDELIAAVAPSLVRKRPKATSCARSPSASWRRQMVWRTTMRSSSSAPFYRDGDPRNGPTTDFQATWRHPESIRRVEDRITRPPRDASGISQVIQFAAPTSGLRADRFVTENIYVHPEAPLREKMSFRSNDG